MFLRALGASDARLAPTGVERRCGSTLCGAIWYQGGKRLFDPNIIIIEVDYGKNIIM